MKSLKRSIATKYAGFALLAIALGATSANAQDPEGKFNLPFTARWGRLVLTPGQYSFSYARMTPWGVHCIELQRERRNLGRIPVLTGTTSERKFSESSLTLVQVGGTYRITRLQLSNPGLNVRFAIPKSEVLEASKTARPSRDVPVLQAAK